MLEKWLLIQLHEYESLCSGSSARKLRHVSCEHHLATVTLADVRKLNLYSLMTKTSNISIFVK